MAYFVAKTLHMRPNTILDEWSAAELTVAFGQYANEISLQNFEDWSNMEAQARNKVARPKKYNVKFFGVTSV